MSPLVEFYRGAGADAAGRTLDEILAFDDGRLEDVHDFIQWLFPLREPSRFNPDAPLVTDADVAEFRRDPALKGNLLRSFARFLAFLGLAYEGGRVVAGPDFERKRGVWLAPNHNWMRVTRVLASLRLLGLEGEGRAFFDYLDGERRGGRSGVGAETFRYWRDAAGPA